MITKTLKHLKGFSRLPVLWLIACLAGSGWLLSLGAAQPKQMPQAASTIGDSPSYVTKRIEDVKAGERVWAFDTVTRQWSAKEVLKPLVHDYQGDLVTVTVQGRSVRATGNHPFWVVAGDQLNDRIGARDVPESDRHRAGAVGRWVAARDLQAGDVLALRDGRFAPIDMVTIRQAPAMKVYNLQVADLHTYAVGDLGIAVHNKPCFPPGTLILMGDGSTKPIELVHVGDFVVARDPATRSTASAQAVTCVIRDMADALVHVTFQTPRGLTSTITSTRFHPFWTSNRGWIKAKDLSTGDRLEGTMGCQIPVTAVAIEYSVCKSFNLTVDEAHTFFAVSDDGTALLVHNVDPWDILYSQPNAGSTFTHGEWAGESVADAIAQAQQLGRLPDGLTLNFTQVGDNWVAANNRTLYVAQQANLPQVHPPTDVSSSKIFDDITDNFKNGTGGPVEPEDFHLRS